ncbi:hypothetical protein F4815DRAFT_444482 [Daldinia loculata]|nr:hypothetical protein F4815DRAFT_444482 [Daldinia loculata]
MPRTIYVLVYPSRLFAAHWSFWLPYVDTDNQQSNIGDRIHVTGDRLNGFKYEYIRNYNVCEDDRNPNAFPLGLVSETHLSLANKDGTVTSSEEEDQRDAENIGFNAFDAACREVPAPGPSLNKVNRDASRTAGTPLKRTEVKDCQWWIKEATSHLFQMGILLPLNEGHEGEAPILRVDNLPRH